MAYTASHSASLPLASARTGNGIVARLKDAIQRRMVYSRTLSELNALTTRELNDLGMSRSMITRVALEAAYGK
jgi:uncharacterized protein YjiS (DUF1127 family)